MQQHPDESALSALAGEQPPTPAALRRIIREAPRDPRLAVLEGLHPLKHALRFGAEILYVALADPERLETYCALGHLRADFSARASARER